MTHATRSTKQLAMATALAVLLAGSAWMLAGAPPRQGPGASRAASESSPPAAGSDGQQADQSRIRGMLGKLPLYFVRNRGQEDSRVAYYVQGRDTAVYFGPDGVTFALSGAKPDIAGETVASRVPVRLASTGPDREAAPRERWAVKLDFVGANRVTPTGQELTPAVVSYFRGRDDQAGSSNETYRGVTYPELWPGIDLVYTGAGGKLKSTFVVKPGADPSRIRLAYRGATGVRVTDAGQLEVSTPVGSFADDKPYAYQETDGRRAEVRVAFALGAATDGAQGYGFTVSAYDRSQTLLLDPTMLVYAGYIGGVGDDVANGIAVDSAGNAYVVGSTWSAVPSFPAKVGPDLTHNGQSDVFVAKIKSDGSDFVYLGYIGGTGLDFGTAIAVDSAGNAYVTGWTTSDQNSFPATVGPHLTYGGAGDAFVAKVKADGSGLVYCGYIGGALGDQGNGIAVDKSGNAYVAGWTESDQTTFPATVGPDLNYNGGRDAFVAKVKADGTALVYAGYIGGAGYDTAAGIAVDKSGNAYVAGWTESDQTTFPATVGPDLNYNGGRDAFVAKVKADGAALVYAGYIGGEDDDEANAIAVDAAGNAYVAGNTSSHTTFPAKIGPDLNYNGGRDAFVAKVKADGTALVYAGYIGGEDDDEAKAIAVDAAGNVYVAGSTTSDASTFPVHVGPFLQYAGGGSDAFAAKVKADGTGLYWAGYIGGGDTDYGRAVAVDSAGNVYVAGATYSTEASFPVTAGPDLISGGSINGFVAKISGKPDLVTPAISVSTSAVKPGGTIAVADMAANWGLGTANASTTRYYLSSDTVKSNTDILLGGGRSVPSLLPGAQHVGNATVTVPAVTPTGLYHVIACADDAKVIAEVDETDNCLATISTVWVTLPDLSVSAVTGTPSVAKPGDKVLITETTANYGAVGSGASTTRYYLGNQLIFLGSRAVPALAVLPNSGWSSVGSVWVTIPLNTPVGSYALVACADGLKAVKEALENNCTSAAANIQVTLPDLLITGVSNPPSMIQRGHSFAVTDTVKNSAQVAAMGTSTTRYYLSKDVAKGAGDILLTGSRTVGPLGPNGTSTGLLTVTVPPGTAAGAYYLLACADDLNNVVKELVETNNCGAAAGPVTVTP